MTLSPSRMTSAVLAALLSVAASASAAPGSSYQMRLHVEGLQPAAGLPAAPPKAEAPAPVQPFAKGELTPDTSADFGALATGSSASRSFTFRNIGNSSANLVFASIPNVPGLSMTANSCGTLASRIPVAAGAACSVTLAFGGSTVSGLEGSYLTIDGGFTAAPSRLALAGTAGGFSASSVWSTTGRGVIVPTTADVAWGGQSLGRALSKTFLLVKSGVGSQSTGVTLTGDTSQFQLVTYRGASDEYNTFTCPSGTGVIATDKASATPCLSASNIIMSLRYFPTELGNHRVTLMPVSNNGTRMPAPLVITATSQFNAAGAWSSSSTSVVPLTDASMAFGAKAVASSTAKSFFMRNTGTNGALAVGFVLSGDATQFKLYGSSARSGAYSDICKSGGILSADKTSITPCLVADAKDSYSTLLTGIHYAPTQAGNHSVTMTPITNNGTVLPGALTFTGSAK